METVFLSIFFSLISKEFFKPAPTYTTLALAIVIMVLSFVFAVTLISSAKQHDKARKVFNLGVGYTILTTQLLILSRVIYLERVIPSVLDYLF